MPRLHVGAILALALVMGCASSDDSASSPKKSLTPAAPPPPPAREEAARPNTDASKMPIVRFETEGGTTQVAVEVVRKPTELARGLMYRRHLPWDRGMLFIFERPEQQSFWMKNTLIPLDMIFIKDDMTVLGVVHRAEPQTTTSRRVEGESQFVLETNGGWAEKHGVRAGTKVTFDRVDQ